MWNESSTAKLSFANYLTSQPSLTAIKKRWQLSGRWSSGWVTDRHGPISRGEAMSTGEGSVVLHGDKATLGKLIVRCLRGGESQDVSCKIADQSRASICRNSKQTLPNRRSNGRKLPLNSCRYLEKVDFLLSSNLATISLYPLISCVNSHRNRNLLQDLSVSLDRVRWVQCSRLVRLDTVDRNRRV